MPAPNVLISFSTLDKFQGDLLGMRNILVVVSLIRYCQHLSAGFVEYQGFPED